MKFNIFHEYMDTDDFIEMLSKSRSYFGSTGFDTKDPKLPRYATAHDADLTVDERGFLEIWHGGLNKRSSVIESVFGLYRIAPSSRNNAYKLAVLIDGEVVSSRKLPTGKSYLFCPRVSKLYVNPSKHTGITLDTSTGELIDNSRFSGKWEVYDVVTFERNET